MIYLELVFLLYDKRTGMISFGIVYSHPQISHFSTHEEVFVYFDFTESILLKSTSLFMEDMQDILLRIIDYRPYWRYQDAFPSSYMTLSIFVIEQVYAYRHYLNFQEIF